MEFFDAFDFALFLENRERALLRHVRVCVCVCEGRRAREMCVLKIKVRETNRNTIEERENIEERRRWR